MNETTVEPHAFVPLKRFRNQGRCRTCFWHESRHPVKGWVQARPLGDKRKALK